MAKPIKPRIVSKKHVARKQQVGRQIKTAVTVTVVVLAVVVVLLGYVWLIVSSSNLTQLLLVLAKQAKGSEFVSNASIPPQHAQSN